MKFNTVEEAIEYLHKVTKQQEIRDETNKLIDRCYTKGSPDYPHLMVFQRQKFLNELLPLLDGLGVVIKVEREWPEWVGCWLLNRLGIGNKFESFNRQFCEDLIRDAIAAVTEPLIKEGV